MRKKIGFVAIIFCLLLVTASSQIAYGQPAQPTQAADEETEADVSSKHELNYEEMNALIDNVIHQKINGVIQFLKKYLLIAWAFFLSCPRFVKNIIIISFIPACIGIITSHVIGIYNNKDKWQKHPDHELMYSYFIKSGTLQRQESYKEAHTLLHDHTWFLISFAGLGYRLGNYDNKSTLLVFVLSFAYIPLSIIGFIEMVFRNIFGTIWLLLADLIHCLILFILKWASILLIPISIAIDKAIQKIQYCPHCYEKFEFPEFVCPSCGRVHKKLLPGKCGVLFARCACNKKFLACTSFTGRSFLASKCPACSGELATANAKHFSIALMGGDDVGKTAFITAFSNLYLTAAKYKHKYKFNVTIEGKPENYFKELDDIFNSGDTVLDTESRTYSMVHKRWKIETDDLVFYKTFAEYVMSEKYLRSPKYFGYCDGIILIIDPLCVQSVKKDLAKEEVNIGATSYSPDDTNEMVVQFIRQFNTVCGSASGALSSVPVAVLINKTDISAVNNEIGMSKIRASYNENPSAYNNNESFARDQICREYLAKIGLINVLNNLEAAFVNVSFFPVSAIGHIAAKGKTFTPVGVIEPVAWIAKKRHSRLTSLISNSIN